MTSKEKFNQIIDDQLKNANNQEKQVLFEAMLEKCCKNMTVTEFETTKSKFMNTKNEKMKFSPMMEMMSSMMGGRMRSGMSGKNPMRDMCMGMMRNMNKTSNDEAYSTDELMDLFKDWCSQVEDEIVAFTKESSEINEEKIAEKFHLSKESVSHLLKNLKESGRI